jgi:hypothetical protein
MRTTYHPWSTRLAQIDQRTEIEQAIIDLHERVEMLGAHPTLTDASSAMFQALCALGAWHDAGEPGKQE